MKILKLRARNINSLKGDTEIDFSCFLSQNALFAITGPTGAGKSTILDIITCALYGKTARLPNPVELMSENCAEAFCEIAFEVKGKQYRSHWGVRRARGNPQGRLQGAKMELTEVESGKIIESKIREVPKAVERICGLDFGRFTQSMMLAQGSFDAFLKAKAPERSALLEKMTGTKIYAQISMAVHKRFSDLKERVAREKEKLGVITLMSEEERQERTQELEALEQSKVEIRSALSAAVAGIAWFTRRETLEHELKEAQKAYAAVENRMEAAKALFERVALAERAAKLEGRYREREASAKRLEHTRSGVEELKREQQSLSGKERKLQAQIAQQELLFSQEERIYIEALAKLKEARRLLAREAEQEGILRNTQDSLEKVEKAYEHTRLRLEEVVKERMLLEEEISEQKHFLAEHHEVENAATLLGVLERDIERYEGLEKELATLGVKLAEAERMYEEKKTLMEERRYTRKREKEKLKSVLEKYVEVESEFLTRKESLPKLQKEYETLQHTLTAAREYRELEQHFEKFSLKLKEKRQKAEKAGQERTYLHEQIAELNAHLATLRKERERALLLQKYEADRAKLKEGEPCYLCGATHHPFALHRPQAEADEVSQEIIKRQQLVEEKEQLLRHTEKHLTRLESEIAQIEETIARNRERCTQLDDGAVPIEEIERSLQQVEHSLKRVHEVGELREEILRNKMQQEAVVRENEILYTQTERALQEVESEKQKLKEQQERVETEAQRLRQNFAQMLSPYALSAEKEALSNSFAVLGKRYEAYRLAQQRVEVLEQKLHELDLKQQRADAEIHQQKERIEALYRESRAYAQKLHEVRSARTAVLNVADLDLYEEERQQRFQSVEKVRNRLQLDLTDLQSRQKSLAAQLKRLEETMVEEEEALKLCEVAFAAVLDESPFVDENAFLEALMPEETLQQERQECRQLEMEFERLKTLLRSHRQRVQKHLETGEPQEDLASLHAQKELLEEKLEELQRKEGELSQELKQDRQNRQRHSTAMQDIALLEKELAIEAKLHELIGSANGAKFATFAQGITLDQLIALANRHLFILSKRYFLTRSAKEGEQLEISIVDRFQGDIVRSVHTLSGGESFIVSLALALGLSELASQKIKIDSLFLDEGFGTLDEESLETALNALNLLQSSGKMIGVISHVSALKERITQQINVIPKGDGTSVVELVG